MNGTLTSSIELLHPVPEYPIISATKTMGNKPFAKKIKELTLEEVDFSEDFFSKAFSDQAETVETLQRGSRKSSLSGSTSSLDLEEDDWLKDHESYDGQLAVDVFQTAEDIYIVSTVAGVRTENLDISMNGDMITIRGMRNHPFEKVVEEDYFIRECYWGGFSRSIILPADIQHDKVEAKLDHGVLVLRLPKSKTSRNSKIEVIEVDE